MREYNIYNLLIFLFLAGIFLGTFTACSVTKFIPEDEFLLDKVKVSSEEKNLNTSSLADYIRQTPNARWFNTIRVPLCIYSLSGRDSTKWMNRTLKKIGDKPVIYDENLAMRSCEDITQALQNIGYMGASVSVKKEVKKKKKINLIYNLFPGERYYVKSLSYDIQDTLIEKQLQAMNKKIQFHEGMVFNVNVLNQERQRITDYLQNVGYYKFNKDYITFTADTTSGTRLVNLTMHLKQFKPSKETKETTHPQYKINNVRILTEFDMANVSNNRFYDFDSIKYKDLTFYYKNKLILRPHVFAENIFLQKNKIYRSQDVQRTYSSVARLHALKYANIHFVEKKNESQNLLDCYILTAPNRPKSFSAELEGTNTAGDLGAAASLTFQHKNIFKGSETFTIKLRGAYEAISGLQGYTNDNYTEYGIETSLNFPRFMFPFLSNQFKRRIRASSEVAIRYNTQERPEFGRRVASLSWSYRWSQRQKAHHKVDLLDINYVYMPWISQTFHKEYLDSIAGNSILKYNYEDLFIARMGYAYSFNSAGFNTMSNSNSYSIRTNFESAGNLLRLASATLYQRKNSEGQNTIGNIAYAQYIKGDFDFTQNFFIDRRNSLIFHVGLGIAYPYGNSKILPFEKRYFSGGANSVRGWSVRSLGPGSYSGGDKNIDFINQSGDMKFDINLEYRTFMFWKLNGALFVDAGNIWTLRTYKEQPGGKFKINSFLKEMAVSYGVGLRLNFDYFILRFDGGMKAINPAFPTSSSEHYPIIHPDFSRDFAFHFAVGYPF